MTKIIGHRGAAGLALENSRESLQAAVKHKVDVIEFDVHLTKDSYVVVIHDKDTGRIANENVLIREKSLAEVQAIELRNGQRILTLDEVLTILGSTPVIIEIKDHGVAEQLPAVLERHPQADASFASFQHDELRHLRELLPDAYIYALDHFKPIEIIQHAQGLHANGIGLNMWLMNPLTYRLAKEAGLDFYVYTVNSRLIAKFYRRLYPGIHLCTNNPERLTDLRKRWNEEDAFKDADN